MIIALPLLIWHPFAQMPVAAFAESLKAWATQVNLKRCSCSPRGPKELAKKEPFDPKHPYVATARLFKQKENRRLP